MFKKLTKKSIRSLLLEPLITNILYKMLSNPLRHIGNMCDYINALDFDGNQIGGPQAAIEHIGINTILIVLNQLDQLLNLFIIHLVHASVRCIGRGSCKDPDTSWNAFIIAWVDLFLVAWLIDTLEKILYLSEVVLLGQFAGDLRVDQSGFQIEALDNSDDKAETLLDWFAALEC